MTDMDKVEKRFWLRVKKTRGCWEWTGRLNEGGYGEIYGHDGRKWKAHRLSYFLAYGEIPDGLFVCHKCDNRKCIRPDHLFLGTAKANTTDAVLKRQQRKGITPEMRRKHPNNPTFNMTKRKPVKGVKP